jgi:hypothetical protein
MKITVHCFSASYDAPIRAATIVERIAGRKGWFHNPGQIRANLLLPAQ